MLLLLERLVATSPGEPASGRSIRALQSLPGLLRCGRLCAQLPQLLLRLRGSLLPAHPTLYHQHLCVLRRCSSWQAEVRAGV